MIDFAAAAMIRLVKAGLQRQNIVLPDLPHAAGAHVALTEKRTAVNALLEKHGPVAILRIGEVIKEMPEEPALVALTLARDPVDLFTRWQRLERFVHSRHRVEYAQPARNALTARHLAPKSASQPTVAEDLLVLGLLTALFEMIGTIGVHVRIGDNSVERKDNEWVSLAPARETAIWHFAWETQAVKTSSSDLEPDPHEWFDLARTALDADPCRRWRLGMLADALNTSPRSLQRRLKDRQSSFSRLLADVRMARSANLLARSDRSFAEIGFVCGFSDQAHFTREFKRHTAFTPARYRSDFVAARLQSDLTRSS